MSQFFKRPRSIAIAILGVILLTAPSFTVSAEAVTIKNGVTCKKSGSATKVGSKRYVCGKIHM